MNLSPEALIVRTVVMKGPDQFHSEMVIVPFALTDST